MALGQGAKFSEHTSQPKIQHQRKPIAPLDGPGSFLADFDSYLPDYSARIYVFVRW